MVHILRKEAKNEMQSKLSDNQTTQFPDFRLLGKVGPKVCKLCGGQTRL